MPVEKYSSTVEDYNTLYETEGYWVFENSKEKPYEGWTEDRQILMFDRNLNVLLACGNWRADGSIEGEALMGQGVTFDAVDLDDMVSTVLQVEKDLFDC